VVRRPILGLSVGAATVRAVLVDRKSIGWAGQVGYTGLAELADVIARLAAEADRPVRRARVVLEREVTQLRSLAPAPPLKGDAMRRWVDLEASRLFRKNGAPLVTAAARVALSPKAAALWAAAAVESLVRAVLDGCAQAGLAVESVGPAAEVLPRALAAAPGAANADPIVIPSGATAEVLDVGPGGAWRSRLVRSVDGAPPVTWVPALATLGEEAAHFAPAYAAAVALPRLQLLPADTRVAHGHAARKRHVRLLAAALCLWVAAGATYIARLSWTLHSSTTSLAALRGSLDSALALRRDLDGATHALATIQAAEAGRSRQLALLAELARALDDSTYVMALNVGAGRTVRLVGYAPRAAKVLAALERVSLLHEARLEGPVTREAANGNRELDRFAIVASLEGRP